MDCRKCGSKKLTRRRAGFFLCQHCGVQPGVLRMDRFGNVPPPVHHEAPADTTEYEIAPLRRRLLTTYS